MVSVIPEVCAEPSGSGIDCSFCLGQGGGMREGFMEKATFELAVQVGQHVFRDRRAGHRSNSIAT